VDKTMWQHNIGHMNEKGMQIIHSINVFPNLNSVDLDFCEQCVYRKQKKVIFFRVREENNIKKLDIVHTYVWGLTQVSSLCGSYYYSTLLMMRLGNIGFITFEKKRCF
jgi:hypothetical protein